MEDEYSQRTVRFWAVHGLDGMQSIAVTSTICWPRRSQPNEYVRKECIWKIKTLRWLPSFSGRLDEGVFDTTSLMPPLGEPDEPSTFSEATLLERKLPFHNLRPITGENIDLGLDR